MGKDSGTLYDGSSSKYWWYELIKGFFWWCGIRVSVHRVAFMCVAEIPNFSFVTEEPGRTHFSDRPSLVVPLVVLT